MIKDFLDNPGIPTLSSLIGLFKNDTEFLAHFGFGEDGEKIELEGSSEEELVDSMESSIDYEEFIEGLGEPDETEIFKGTEWSVSKLVWYSPEKTIYTLKVLKISEITDSEITDSEIKRTLTFEEQMENALANEDYAEAIKLRDWNLKFVNKIKSLGEVISKAIDEGDHTKLIEYLEEIKTFKGMLNKKK